MTSALAHGPKQEEVSEPSLSCSRCLSLFLSPLKLISFTGQLSMSYMFTLGISNIIFSQIILLLKSLEVLLQENPIPYVL